MVEKARLQRHMRILRAIGAAQGTDHGSYCTPGTRWKKHKGKRCSGLQNLQQRQKTSIAHGMGTVSEQNKRGTATITLRRNTHVDY